MALPLLAFLFLLTYDGALRKWAIPGGEQILIMLKDVLLFVLLAYVVLTGSYRQAGISVPAPVQLAFWLYAAWVMLETLNQSLPNVLVGLWGAKAHLLYAALILVMPLAFRTPGQLFATFEKIYPYVVIPVCALAFVQVTLPADHFLNQQVRGGIEGIAVFGDANLVRVAGTFSYITGMGAFVQVTALLGVGLYIAGARSWPFLAGLGFALGALPVTGSRGVVLAVSLGAIAMFTAGVLARAVSPAHLARAICIVGALFIVSLAAQDATWEALQQRFEANREEGTPRIITAFTNAFDHMPGAGAFGFGAGAANFGAIALAPNEEPFSWLPVGMNFEEESGRIVLELGAIGWGLSMLMRIAMLFWAVSLVLGASTLDSRVAAAIALPFMVLGVHQGSGVFAASYMSVAYWFCAALLAMASYEDLRVRRQRRSAWHVGRVMARLPQRA